VFFTVVSTLLLPLFFTDESLLAVA